MMEFEGIPYSDGPECVREYSDVQGCVGEYTDGPECIR